MNRREIVGALGAFLVGPSFMRAFDPYFDAEMPEFKGDKGFDWAPPPDPIAQIRARLLMLEEPIDELWRYRTVLLGPEGEAWDGPRRYHQGHHRLQRTRDLDDQRRGRRDRLPDALRD